jgi:hypothetical protein
LGKLNPIQLRKSAKEYRYEVDEPKFPEQCSKYLMDLQRQWETTRIGNLKTLHGILPGLRGADESQGEDNENEMARKMIDESFKHPEGFSRYTPPSGVETLGELLDSRYMVCRLFFILPCPLYDEFFGLGTFCHSLFRGDALVFRLRRRLRAVRSVL